MAAGVAGVPVRTGCEGELVTASMREPALVGALSSACGCRGQRAGREAATAAPLLARHSTIALHFYDSLAFVHKHSQLWISSLPSPQAISS